MPMISWYALRHPLLRATANIKNSKMSMIDTRITADVGTSKGVQPTMIFQGRMNNMAKTNARIAGNVVDTTCLMLTLPGLLTVLMASPDANGPGDK
ncbi:MAG: hypothetical protein KAR39_03370 [Thermoplasmata archaeon]|nr:hypothetical protein [Thermoplasmata archaeon]